MGDEVQIKMEKPLEEDNNSELIIEDQQTFGEESFEMQCDLNEIETTDKLLEIGSNKFNPIEVTPNHRLRRSDAIIFSPPFFSLQDILTNGRIAAKCLTCGRLVRGYKNVSSNYIQHMKNIHPDKLKIYESIKGGFRRTKMGSLKSVLNSANSTALCHSDSSSIDGGNSLNESVMSAPAAEIQQPAAETAFIERCSTATANSIQKPAKDTPSMNAGNKETQIDLSAKTIEAMSKLLDSKLKAFVTHNELTETRENLKNFLERRLSTASSAGTNGGTACSEYSQGDGTLKAELEVLQNECKELREQMMLSRQSKRQLQREIQILDRNVRQRKIVVRNLLVESSQKSFMAIESLIRGRLGLINIRPLKVTPLPSRNMGNNLHNFLVEFPMPGDVRMVLSNARKLKNTGIFIEPDMSYAARKRKDKLLTLKRELLRRKSDLNVIIRGAELVVANKTFFWDEVEGLCYEDHAAVNQTPTTEQLDAINHLKLATSLDMREFINFLRHYDVQAH